MTTIMGNECIIVYIDNNEDSISIQKLCFSRDITWGGDKHLYIDENCYYAIIKGKVDNGFKNMIYYRKDFNDYNKLIKDFSINGIYYDSVNDFDFIRRFILYDSMIPSYKPKKILRRI